MSLAKYVENYDQLLEFMYLVVNSLKGKQLPDYRFKDCERLATKIFIHAVTIGHLRHGSNVTLTHYPDGAHIDDFASMIVLARAVLETYCNLFEIFFEPTTEDEFEYRHAVYQLEGFTFRERYFPKNPDEEMKKKIQEQLKEIDQMRDRVRSTNRFKSFSKEGERNRSLKGKIQPERRTFQVAVASGFAEEFINNRFDMFSGYVHGDALSIAQISEVLDETKRDIFVHPTLFLVMMTLSKLILNFEEKFSEAKVVCAQNTLQMRLVTQLADVAGKM